jgi:hypothetical protein
LNQAIAAQEELALEVVVRFEILCAQKLLIRQEKLAKFRAAAVNTVAICDWSDDES